MVVSAGAAWITVVRAGSVVVVVDSVVVEVAGAGVAAGVIAGAGVTVVWRVVVVLLWALAEKPHTARNKARMRGCFFIVCKKVSGTRCRIRLAHGI